MSPTKRLRIDPRKGEDDKSEDLPGERALPKGGGDPPKRSRDEDALTAKASGGATISHAVQLAQGVAAGAGVDAESVGVTFSYRDTPEVKLANLRASAARQLKAQGRTDAEIAQLIAGLGVPGTPPSSSSESKAHALEELLKKLGVLDFYKGKPLFAALTAGPRALSEDDQTPMLLCLKEPTAPGVGMAPVGSQTHTLEACVAKISAEAESRGQAVPKLAHVDGDDWAARPLGATGDIIRATLLALGSHADGIGFGDTLAHIVPFKEVRPIRFQADVHAPLEGAFAAAHAMLEFYVVMAINYKYGRVKRS